MKNVFLKIWRFFFPLTFATMTGGDDAVKVSKNFSGLSTEFRNDAGLSIARVTKGGTVGKINFRRSDPRHPYHVRYYPDGVTC